LTNALAEPLARYGFKKDAEKVQVGLPTNNSRESNARRQLNTFVASILSTFVVCRLPWYIWHIIKAHGFRVPLNDCQIVTDVTFCLAYASSAINPLIYIFVGNDFRRRCKTCRRFIEVKIQKYQSRKGTKDFGRSAKSRAKDLKYYDSVISKSDSHHEEDVNASTNVMVSTANTGTTITSLVETSTRVKDSHRQIGPSLNPLTELVESETVRKT